MASDSDVVQGVCAVLGAPLVMSAGLLLWDKYWLGSAVRKTHARLKTVAR